MAFLAAVAASASAQDSYTAQKLSSSDLNGTARYVGMGGAMGALGGDLSVMSSNPAGMGIFRHSEMAVTGSLNTLSGEAYKNTSQRASLDNFGVVVSLPYSNYSSLRYVNYGFAFRKKKNFFDSYDLSFGLNDQTQTDQVALLASYNLDNYGWGKANVDNWNGALARIGVQNGLLSVKESEDGTMIDEITAIDAKSARYVREQTGGISEFDFNVALNFDEQLYLGATVGIYDVKFNRNSYYTEFPLSADLSDYTICNRTSLSGTGVDLKLGAIFRPVEDNPFRFGVAIHTPTYYSLTDNTSYYVATTAGQSPVYHLGDYDYQLVTPWKFNINAGTTVGGMLAIGAEYEYEDFSAVRFKDYYGNSLSDLDDDAREALKGVGTFKIGAEARLSPEFSIRAGYNHSSAAFKDDAYKNVFWDSEIIETQYDNSAETNRFTVGAGYRSGSMSVDFAYQYSATDNKFYAFDGHSGVKNDYKRNQFMLTLGYRF